MDKYLTIQEAAKSAQISESTIRRAIKTLPKHEQAAVKKIKGKIFISYSWLSTKYAILAEPYEPDRAVSPALEASQRQIDKLMNENSTQAAELREAWQIIAALRERLASLGAGDRNQPPEHDLLMKIILIALVLLACAFLWTIVGN
jgi:hypothetical protein